MVQLPPTPSQMARAMPRFEWDPRKNIMVIRIGSIDQAACVVPVLPSMRALTGAEKPSDIWSRVTKFVLNTKVDTKTFATYY